MGETTDPAPLFPGSGGTGPSSAFSSDPAESRPAAFPRPGDDPPFPPRTADPQLAGTAAQQAKAELRRWLLSARVHRSLEQRQADGRALRDVVLGMPQAQMAGTVAAYWSMTTEPDTHGLVYALWKRGSYVLLPMLRPDADLDWASYEGPDSLRPGPRGFAEPVDPPRGVAAIESADLVITPALAVDRRGVRLGRGGGSYDRALARVHGQIPVIALLFEGELLDGVPAEDHDERVGLVAQPVRGITTLPMA